MNLPELRRNLSHRLWPLFIATGMFLAACGGGGGGGGSTQTAGIGGTGIVAGKITNFGSVYVNGDRYEIRTSQIIVDGEGNKSEGDLKLGMVVRLKVETENGAFTDKAIEVVYDDEIQGPVEATPVTSSDGKQKTFDILGQMITIDDVGTLFEGTSFGAIDQNDALEISGFRSATGIIATYVKLESDPTEAELQGTIEAPLTGTTFMIGSVTVTYDVNDLAPGLILQVGQNVEVKGTFQSQTAIEATEIDLEDDDFDDEVDDISLQGVVSDIASGISNFLLGTQRVDASGIAGLTLTDGMNIEVEGEIVAGKLIADEVEFRDGDTKLRTFVNNVEPGDTVFRVNYLPLTGTVTVVTNGQTLFEDETGAILPNPPFSVDDLAPTDFVRIEGQEINGEVVASIVKRVDGVGRDLRLEGAVDSHVDNASITILGIQYAIDPDPDPNNGTSFEGFPDSASFFAVLSDGDFVEIDDDFLADGVADEVEFE